MPARSKLTPFRLSLLYAIFATIWIIGSDDVLRLLVHSTRQFAWLEMGKGVLFVAITSAVLYFWARQFHAKTIDRAQEFFEARQRKEQARRMYETLSAVNRQIIRPTNANSLQQAICDALIDPGAFRCAWIGRLNPARSIIWPVAQAGGKPAAQIAIDTASLSGDAGKVLVDAIRTGHPATRPALNDTGDTPLGNLVRTCRATSCVAIPFHPESADPLLLVVYGSDAEACSLDTVTMLSELVDDLKHGLDVIAERERRAAAETALRASEERYRLVAENSQDVIWIMSREGKIQYISPSIKRLLGYTPSEIMRLGFEQYLTPASLRRVKHELHVAREERANTGRMRSRLLELEQIRADGTPIWTEVHTMEFNDDANQWIGILGVTRDITERRAAAQALASEIARCRALLDVSVDGIEVLDVNGRLLDANEIFLRERGFTREMIPSLTIENWNVEMTGEQVRAHLSSFETELFFETMHRRHDGKPFPVEMRARRVEIDGRTVVYCTTRDISERKNLEQRVLRAQRLESVGLIASGIAHDLNNVLTPILLSTGLLEMRYNRPEDRSLLEPIESAARRGSNIVQQILTFARGADGERVAIEPKILLKELGSLIRETFPRNIVHRLEIATDVRMVTGDPTHLHQVFLNLAVNARDAMPDGGTLTIEARNRRIELDDVRKMPLAKPGEYVCISVSDTGSGMTPAVLDHLFEPFFTTKPRGRGTGLGLSTVHGLVRSHGGFVDVNSQLGHGSDFRVFLPVAPNPQPTAAATVTDAPKQLGRGELILVTDDEEAIRIVVESVLRRHGFEPLMAADGAEAIGLFDQHVGKVALVITDVMMPKFDGVRLASEVRRRSQTLPIIAMSGLIAPTGTNDSREQLRQLGVTCVIDKPYGEADLLKAIARALKRDGAAESPTPVVAEVR